MKPVKEGSMAQAMVPAAQYLRMSTDHQQYSLDNQADVIVKFATTYNFSIIKTYADGRQKRAAS